MGPCADSSNFSSSFPFSFTRLYFRKPLQRLALLRWQNCSRTKSRCCRPGSTYLRSIQKHPTATLTSALTMHKSGVVFSLSPQASGLTSRQTLVAMRPCSLLGWQLVTTTGSLKPHKCGGTFESTLDAISMRNLQRLQPRGRKSPGMNVSVTPVASQAV